MDMKISVIIVSLNGRRRIDLPLKALAKCNPAPAEVIVVDNGSHDGLSRYTRRNHPEVRLIRTPRNLGFAGGNNLGIVNARGDILVLLNDDTEPETDWLAPLEKAFAKDPGLGVAGCQLLYPGGERIQHLGGFVAENGLTDHGGWGEEAARGNRGLLPCEYVTGAALAARREVFAQAGLLDPGFWPIYFEEVDFCARARKKGWEVAVVPESQVIHHESQTTGRMSQRFLRLYHRNRLRYLLKNRRSGDWPSTLRAEARWLVHHHPWDQLWACALAYAWAPFQAWEIMRRGGR
jgi:GT2 family glycosyltransferase